MNENKLRVCKHCALYRQFYEISDNYTFVPVDSGRCIWNSKKQDGESIRLPDDKACNFFRLEREKRKTLGLMQNDICHINLKLQEVAATLEKILEKE